MWSIVSFNVLIFQLFLVINSMTTKWYSYALQSLDDSSTYIGMTCNLERRLKQHCSILKGGAKATHGKQHQFLFYVSGFQSMVQALRFEWALKHPFGPHKRRKPGINGCYESLLLVMGRDKWTSKSEPASTVPLTIHWLGEPVFYKENSDKFPDYILHDISVTTLV